MIPRASRWADFSTVKPAVSLEAVLADYQVPGLRRHRDHCKAAVRFITANAPTRSVPI
jgi:hypothetical protein